MPLTEIQRLLGHASVQTTERSKQGEGGYQKPQTAERYISTTPARLKQSTVVLERGKDRDPRPLGSSPILKPAIAGIH